jgi:hypothetical protein
LWVYLGPFLTLFWSYSFEIEKKSQKDGVPPVQKAPFFHQKRTFYGKNARYSKSHKKTLGFYFRFFTFYAFSQKHPKTSKNTTF